MKNLLNFKSIVGLAIISMFLVSCAHSDKVVSNNLIQKRKYNKGFFIDFKKNNNENLAVNSKREVKSEQVKEVVESNKNLEITASNDVVNETVIITKHVNNVETKETTTTTNAPIEQNIVVSKKVQKIIDKVNKTVEKQNKKAENKDASSKRSSGKSQLIALLLVVFVGSLGIHRFYLGYTWQGVVQLLTLGACGIWSLIDLIRIITGDLGPKSGKYSKTL